jgi:hypothetical protein
MIGAMGKRITVDDEKRLVAIRCSTPSPYSTLRRRSLL